MEEMLFCAMDISKEARGLLNKVTDSVCDGMTGTEKKAYEIGVENAMNAVVSILESSDEPIVYVPNLEVSEEMTLEELKEHF